MANPRGMITTCVHACHGGSYVRGTPGGNTYRHKPAPRTPRRCPMPIMVTEAHEDDDLYVVRRAWKVQSRLPSAKNPGMEAGPTVMAKPAAYANLPDTSWPEPVSSPPWPELFRPRSILTELSAA